ncbi:MAG TPA: hypothetical protein VJP79_10830 [Nitrososphaera sp.]|nr:hypothetical protein [Nitrososphaera sp.]
MSQDTGKFVCSACGQSFNTEQERESHNQQHHPEMAKRAGQSA